MNRIGYPEKQGLYDPQFEHDACGIGFVANIKGKRSHEIIKQSLQVLGNLDHRGGQGSETNTGDGAGILMQIPHTYFQKECKSLNIELPQEDDYGIGMMFLPHDESLREQFEQKLTEIIHEEGQQLLGFRTVPTNDRSLGSIARSCQPYIRQVFIGKNKSIADHLAFERKLYVIRKRAENAIRFSGITGGEEFYFSSLSSRTMIYKGMLVPAQVAEYYVELQDPSMETSIALVHSRFSTNTFPSWERAHPYRYLIHNGEINTLRGNVNWMHARQAMCDSEHFGDDIKKILPIIDPEGSDSQMFDNCLEFLMLAGRPLPHAAMMMIPEPWHKNDEMSAKQRAFYEYHSTLMEPWDGPAAIAFTDGRIIGSVLDRNGLRPARYYVTDDDMIVMASEAGVMDIAPERVVKKERLHPGRMLLVDTEQGRIISDEELKEGIASEEPYEDWIAKYMLNLEDLPEVSLEEPNHEMVELRQKAFGYTYEVLNKIVKPMAQTGVEPVGSMGVDSPLAVLSDKPQPLYHYFKQLFAQVTNPPIDAIREELVTSMLTTIGSEGNLIDPEPQSCLHIRIDSPVISNEELAKLRHISVDGFKSETLPILFKANQGSEGMEQALKELFQAADRAIQSGVNLLILSDVGVNMEHAAIPALLAVSGLHHHLIREGTRTKVSLILEAAEPREVHHFATLLGYGVSAINPYLAFESLDDMIQQGLITDLDHKTAVKNYLKASAKGIAKILSKMGISTVQSYRGAQIFEAIGISQEVIDKYFTWTASRIGGIDLHTIAEEVLVNHKRAFNEQSGHDHTLDPGGAHQWRKEGEYHLYNPQTVHTLQHACRTNNYELYKSYSGMLNEQTEQFKLLRGMLKFKEGRKPIPIEEVESVESIVRRFKTGAMSYGSISGEAHESLAIAMNRLGGKSNTGEGGENPNRFTPDENGDLRRSAIKQVASGRFGVTSHYLVNADEIQIKMAQGAKPGEGGQLPGKKVYPWIAEVRGSTPGVGLISPPPHHDIYSIEDLAELIHDLKNANPRARISVKLVSEVGVGTIAAGVAKGRADVVLISGYDGGTGASPMNSIHNAGLPWELGLAETHQILMMNNLRDRIAVETDGKLMTGRDVAVATLLGAEEYGFATAPLVVLGCVMMRVCHMDTCPVGVATQNPELRKKFMGDPDHVVNFMRFIAQDFREIMAELGFRSVAEMVGRKDVLEAEVAVDHWKAKGLDLSSLLYMPEVDDSIGTYCRVKQDHQLDQSLDRQVLLKICEPALDHQEHVHGIFPIKNTNRVVGTILGSEVTKRYGAEGLPHDTIRLHFIGSAGQSFGAFVPKGMTLSLEGDANDYLGKGLSGGKLIVYPSDKSKFEPENNIITGNVAFYGATDGEAYIRGVAGERFCVRNSGMHAVVEGVGDHGCEYMTGGRVVVLGTTGRNFAAGMSGGIAYVLDENGSFESRCNSEMIFMESLDQDYEVNEVKAMIHNHVKYTQSKYAQRILNRWEELQWKFVKVIPKDYKRMLESIERNKNNGLDHDAATMAAFQENAQDKSRVSGN